MSHVGTPGKSRSIRGRGLRWAHAWWRSEPGVAGRRGDHGVWAGSASRRTPWAAAPCGDEMLSWSILCCSNSTPETRGFRKNRDLFPIVLEAGNSKIREPICGEGLLATSTPWQEVVRGTGQTLPALRTPLLEQSTNPLLRAKTSCPGHLSALLHC